MHKDIIFTETGKQNRRGVAYRKYADGKITNIDIMSKVIAEDICSISANRQPFYNTNDIKILIAINRQMFDVEPSNEVLTLMTLAFEFGAMKGGKVIRDKLKCRSRGKAEMTYSTFL